MATDKGDAGRSAPFVFHLTEEKLRECRDMTTEEKLRWLEEANAFVRKFVPPEQLARWARLVEGPDRPASSGPTQRSGE